MEHCSLGTLEAFLQDPNVIMTSCGSITDCSDSGSQILMNTDDLLAFSLQIARGMAFIASRNVIHRNLATQKCTTRYPKKLQKLTDFGLARESEKTGDELQTGTRKLIYFHILNIAAIL